MRADRNLWRVVLVLAMAMLLLPLSLTEIPPLLDYPNHLARMFVLKHLPSDPVLAQMYEAQWRILPNIGMDFFVPALSHVLSLNISAKIFITLALTLPTLGVVMLHRALFGVRSYWPLGSMLIAYNMIFLLGFLNFLVGIGLALIVGAIWYHQRQHGFLLGRILLASTFALLIFFCHLIACIFFGLLLVSIEVGAAWVAYRAGKLTIRGSLRGAAAIFLAFAMPFVLLLTAPIANETGQDPGVFHAFYENITRFQSVEKVEAAVSPFLTYSPQIDLIVALLVGSAIIRLLLTKRLVVSPYPLFAMISLVLLFPFIPFYMKETGFVDYRLSLFAVFLVFAGTAPKQVSRRELRVMAAFGGAAFLVRLVLIGVTWTTHNGDLADLSKVIAPIEPGSSVLTVQTRGGRRRDIFGQIKNYKWRVSSRFLASGRPTYWHLPALVVIERQALIPLLFTHPWKQPLQVQPASRDLTMNEGVPPPVDMLAATDPQVLTKVPYLRDWQGKYDYILVLLPTRDPQGVDSLLQWADVLGSHDIAALYRVRHDGRPKPSGLSRPPSRPHLSPLPEGD